MSAPAAPSSSPAPAAPGAPSAAPAAAPAPGAAAPTPYASASLYVGDLTSDVSEALLFEIFNAVGPVASVRVCRDASTRRSLGYAYVNFHRMEDAERALETMNFKSIRGRQCRIMWSHRDPSLRKSGLGNIFVNHLAKTIDHKTLYDTFSLFGNILSCKVAMNAKRDSLGYGFVHYESEESAKAAIEKVDGKMIAGQQVQVTHFKSKKERGSNQFKYTNVFVKNLPGETTKEQLDGLFSKYGVITSTMINTTRDDKTKAFGFVNFNTPEEAAKAVEAAHNSDYMGRKLYVARAQKKEERDKELKEKFEQLRVERAKKWQGVNLYVKNLSDETDDEKLSTEFAKFGSISSAKVMRDSVGKSKGFGFVCYATPEEATKAVTEMNGHMLDSKPLYVALAQRKEVRRAQLEAQYAARQKLNPMPGVNGLGGVNGLPVMGGPMPYPQGPIMFPAGLPPQARGQFVYPGQMGVNVGLPRFNPAAAQMMMRPGQIPMNYQLMPVNAGARGMPQGMPLQQGQVQGRQQRGQNRQPRQQPAAVVGGLKLPSGLPSPQPSGIRYADNVRNRQQPSMASGMPSNATPSDMLMPSPNEPLTIKALALAPEEMRKQMIGERLFPLIKNEQPNLAGKITGMLLEMDNSELIHLLETPTALHEKIQEAMQVLQQHPQEEEQNEAQ